MNVKIRSIWQHDNDSFVIRWNDGIETLYRLADLQRQCPCAGCVDETTGIRKPSSTSIRSEVRAKRVYSVGNYAIKIEFTEGCSHGIYDYTLLRSKARP